MAIDVLATLNNIDPALLTYEEWLAVGMALKEDGYTAHDWEVWSSRDPKRHKQGECYRKWESFNGSYSKNITSGSIVKLAQDYGASIESEAIEDGPITTLDWDSFIGGKNDNVKIVDKDWVEPKEVSVPEGKKWNPVKEITKYLSVLFQDNDHVAYTTESYERDGKWFPKNRVYDRSCATLIEEFEKCKGDIGKVLGDTKSEAGAWVQINPVDGRGCKNENVTEYRYVLVESDTMSLDKQNAILRELELPIAALVNSGGKSLHAIVRIEARNLDEYRKRVDYLYQICRKNGFEVDNANKNPSRLSRFPGFVRGDSKQFLVDTNIGKTSWKEWQEWIENISDDLPDPESLADVWDNMEALADPLIDGVLRMGHKMLIAGPSKAGKSYALIELCAAIASGSKWFGWQCARGRVLYVNLELDRASCQHRFKDVFERLGVDVDCNKNIDIWNLRGKTVPMDKLAPKLIRRAAKKDYIAVIIDPIYKVITGDENSADQMSKFCNQFDLVCNELGSAVIYCHHHSKGSQGQKRSADRASGSGVFARDPDSLLDLIELELNDDVREALTNQKYSEICTCYLDKFLGDTWRDEVEQDIQVVGRKLWVESARLLSTKQYGELTEALKREDKNIETMTAWRIDGTLREFPKFTPLNLLFDYPVHTLDGTGMLSDLVTDAEIPSWKKGSDNHKKQAKVKKKKELDEFKNAVENANFGKPPTKKQVSDYLGISPRSVERRVTESNIYKLDFEDGKSDGMTPKVILKK